MWYLWLCYLRIVSVWVALAVDACAPLRPHSQTSRSTPLAPTVNRNKLNIRTEYYINVPTITYWGNLVVRNMIHTSTCSQATCIRYKVPLPAVLERGGSISYDRDEKDRQCLCTADAERTRIPVTSSVPDVVCSWLCALHFDPESMGWTPIVVQLILG